MTHYGTWSPYAGSSSIILAVVLLIVMGVLMSLAMRLDHPIAVKRLGRVLSVSLVVLGLLSVTTFLVAASIYGYADEQQKIHFTGPMNPIAPVTITSGVLAFFVIVSLAQRSGFWVAVGSAIVGTIAAPMIFELPFDLIVVGRTYPPAPARRDLKFCAAHVIAFREAVESYPVPFGGHVFALRGVGGVWLCLSGSSPPSCS